MLKLSLGGEHERTSTTAKNGHRMESRDPVVKKGHVRMRFRLCVHRADCRCAGIRGHPSRDGCGGKNRVLHLRGHVRAHADLRDHHQERFKSKMRWSADERVCQPCDGQTQGAKRPGIRADRIQKSRRSILTGSGFLSGEHDHGPAESGQNRSRVRIGGSGGFRRTVAARNSAFFACRKFDFCTGSAERRE